MIHIGDKFSHPKYGEFSVVSYEGCCSVGILFSNTGYMQITTSQNIRSLSVKDRLFRDIFGVGFIGSGRYKSRDSKGIKNRSYVIWRGILSRCYNKKDKRYSVYGGKGVSVCDEWHNFQNFAEWDEKNYPKDGALYHLDKDKLSGDVKIYSPSTCLYMTARENVSISRSKSRKLISPNGEIVCVKNMSEFCDAKGLLKSKMCLVVNGKRNHHKGWRNFNG